jgi:hypothetical protein
MMEEIAREAEEELARATKLTRDVDKGKRHNGLHDDSGSSNDEPRDDRSLEDAPPKVQLIVPCWSGPTPGPVTVNP